MDIEKNIRKPVQKRSIEMREKVLNSAMKLICEKGFFKTTTTEIANDANISVGSLYSYFIDKDSILMELLDRYNENFLLIFDSIDNEATFKLYKNNNKEWIRQLIDNLLSLHISAKEFSREINMLYYAKPEVALVVDAQLEKVRVSTFELIKKNHDDFKDIDLEAMSLIITDFTSTLVDRIVFMNNIVDKEKILNLGIEMIHSFLKECRINQS